VAHYPSAYHKDGIFFFNYKNGDDDSHVTSVLAAHLKEGVCNLSEGTDTDGMHTVRVCSLGQITNALFEVGGQYRRNM